MMIVSNKSLMSLEDLTLPRFQVIVMSASMGCTRCRERVSFVVSKMTGLSEYSVDMRNKQVTLKGDFGYGRKEEDRSSSSSDRRTPKQSCLPLKLFVRSLVASCFKGSTVN
ncbi:hypothetical protein K2173_024002 [Erythroxylum novogranatense]|uniref:HMA domain-containing protein n=1 Tax=Erythroxylum novogranatense TaxID=1862640 RepID=A0AAV8TQ60_9ROSI|nr:hypothetical protein K2173_024002 [Erythroxylum novogranatense]